MHWSMWSSSHGSGFSWKLRLSFVMPFSCWSGSMCSSSISCAWPSVIESSSSMPGCRAFTCFELRYVFLGLTETVVDGLAEPLIWTVERSFGWLTTEKKCLMLD
jgi:hypothetical protein